MMGVGSERPDMDLDLSGETALVTGGGRKREREGDEHEPAAGDDGTVTPNGVGQRRAEHVSKRGRGRLYDL